MNRVKIAKDVYSQSGYGRGRKKAIIWLIDGKLYAKDKANHRVDFDPLTGELEGYVRIVVSYSPIGSVYYHQVSGTLGNHTNYIAPKQTAA